MIMVTQIMIMEILTMITEEVMITVEVVMITVEDGQEKIDINNYLILKQLLCQIEQILHLFFSFILLKDFRQTKTKDIYYS